MIIDTHFAQTFQSLTERYGACLSVEVGDNDTAHVKTTFSEHITKAKHILVVSDAEVAAHLVSLNVVRTNHNDDFHVIAQLHEHSELAVGMKTWQHTTGMIVVVEFSAKFEIKLIVELSNTFFDAFRLNTEIFVVVES